MTLTGWDDVKWVVYPVCWCPACDADRPHHGPFCMTCGTDREADNDPA